MQEVEVKFEREERQGVVPVGTYLIDTANRLGVRIETECQRRGTCDSCAVTIIEGEKLLSKPTKTEIEHLSEEMRKSGKRLACQAKIIELGEIKVMTTEKKTVEPTDYEKFRKDFQELPLNEKVKNLVELELITLGEAFSYILDLPNIIGEKIRDGLAEVGMKMDEEEKKASRPEEHQEEKVTVEPTEEKKTSEKKTAAKKKTSSGETTKTTGRQRKKPAEKTEKE